MKNKTLSTVLAAMVCAACSSAGAGAEPQEHEVYAYRLTVHPADAEEIYADIRRQAARFCRIHGDAPRLNVRAEQACRERLIEEGLDAVDQEAVRELHETYQRRR